MLQQCIFYIISEVEGAPRRQEETVTEETLGPDAQDLCDQGTPRGSWIADSWSREVPKSWAEPEADTVGSQMVEVG